MNLEYLSSIFNSLSPLKIRQELCSRLITPRSNCEECLRICPSKSITFFDGTLEVNQCCYCGMCVPACPNHVFKIDEDKILEDASKNSQLIITCSPVIKELNAVKDKKKLTIINCFGQLYGELLVKLLFQVQELTIYLDQEYCNKCLKYKADNIYTVLDPFKGLIGEKYTARLKIVNRQEELLGLVNSSTSTRFEQDRREFFRSLLSNTRKVPQSLVNYTLEKLEPEGSQQPKRLEVNNKNRPAKRLHLLHALAREDSSHSSSDMALPYKYLRVKDCNLCPVCSKLCPTRALEIRQVENKKELVFNPQLCTECNICQDVCHLKGIDWADQVLLKDFTNKKPVTVATGTSQQCARCKTEFWYLQGVGATKKSCPWCKDILD
ncbi:4Fe-4S dicluster domain-containing protein [Desulfitibacter alkalitolerans]|uniref:4Fe-4S dicluster domain-containing protein n=1 Tax=Desulfitibacter alkalitolerans TaxID=264641 RepID=UPI0004824BDD|nr:4Fe-4S dicluster domain-containing protein [Desulfitibacter alkalitolerans]